MQGPLLLDRYRPIEVKGEGGSGTVELCWDTRIQRRVAIKRMPISSVDANGVVAGLAEARTGAMLNRPSIVSVYDFDATDTEAFLIMEAIEGPTLSQLIRDTPPATFDLDIAAAILTAVGDAICFAHENQVLHLDIKPDNILITRSGACKVSDFGVAELAGASGFGEASGGTIGYMPPEQMHREALDERCDEFSFAVVAYEILTGKCPFAAKTLDASTKLIKASNIAAPSDLRGDLDPGIDNVLFAALSPRREDRYDDVDDFLDALMPYLGNAAQGAKRLHEIASAEEEDDEEERYASAVEGLWGRVPPRLATIAGRIISAALCWWVATSALVGIPALSFTTAALIALLPALGAAVKPPFGTLIALAMCGIATLLNPVGSPVAGAVILGIAVIWIILFGKEGTADANCALIVSPLELIGFTPLAPLLAGFCLPPKRALGAVLVQTALMLAPVNMTSVKLPLGGVTSVQTWIIIIAWVLSAILMSLLCSRQTRLSSVLGSILAACILLAAKSVALRFAMGIWMAPDIAWTVSTALACVIMCIVTALGATVRYKGEE